MNGLWRRLGTAGLTGEEALRAELLRQILAACSGACLLYIGLAALGQVRSFLFPLDVIEMLAACGACAWLLHRRAISTATVLLVAILSHPVSFLIASYGFGSPAPGLLMPTIIVCGLLVGRRLMLGWTLVCCAILAWIALVRRELDGARLPSIALWWSLYVSAGWLITLFSKHLERLLAASRAVEEAERAAVVAERTRMARDIHDTLAQGFTGIVVLMNAAEDALARRPDQVSAHLHRARALARQSLEEARRSVWALRSPAPANGDLLATIEEAANRIVADARIEMASSREGDAYPLPRETEANLLSIAREAVTNTLRHAEARRVDIRLCYKPDALTLEIRDDGKGMLEAESGGLGLKGMAERAAQFGGNVDFATGGGAGMTVRVVAPRGKV